MPPESGGICGVLLKICPWVASNVGVTCAVASSRPSMSGTGVKSRLLMEVLSSLARLFFSEGSTLRPADVWSDPASVTSLFLRTKPHQ